MSDLIDSATRHQIFVQRYAAGREAEAVKSLLRIKAEVESRLAGDITAWSRARLDTMLLDITGYSRSVFVSMGEDMLKEAVEFGEYEGVFSARLLTENSSASIFAIAPVQMQSAIYTSVMQLEPRKGYTIQNALHQFTDSKSRQIVQRIKDGVILGDTTEKIRADLEQTFEMQKQHARTLARTVTNHVSSVARMKTIEENADILDGYEWVSTLDSRTSMVCMSRDGIVYPISEDPIKSPKPPAHFSCRSTTIPKVNPKYSLISRVTGQRPSRGAEGPKVVAGNTTYNDWLKTQPESFQNQVLGKQKAMLFRNGGLNLGAFVNDIGDTLTLDELRALEPLAFERAGL